MQSHGAQPERVSRLDCYDLMSPLGEPCGIAPGAGTDVEYARARARQQMQHGTVNVLRSEALLARKEIVGLRRVAFGAAHMLRHRRLLST